MKPGRKHLPSRLALLLLVSLLVVSAAGLGSAPAAQAHSPAPRLDGQAAPPASPAELVQLVNQLRKANGLPPYKVNSALMSAAQAHSEYQASIGTVTHTGQGGTRPRDRAVAYGFGGGGSVFVSENIAGGTSISAAFAMQMWQGDSLHLGTMLGANYTDVGAGVASADGATYFTLDAGYVAGAQAPPPAATLPGGTPAPTQPAATAGPVIIPVAAATPLADGSIVHEVQQGQALWNIAAIYKTSITELLSLNGLTENSFIHPGDKLLVRAAQTTPTAAPSPTAEASPTPAASRAAARLPSRTPAQAQASGLAAAPPSAVQSNQQATIQTPAGAPVAAAAAAASGAAAQNGLDPLLLGIVALGVIGTALILLGTLLRRGA